MRRFLMLLLVGGVLGMAGLAFSPRPKTTEVRARLEGLKASPGEFMRADGPRTLVFPRDHGAHEDFQTEWWYFTGNLSTAEGREFGFQLTFFRRGLLPLAQQLPRKSTWATDQVYLAHFALADVKGRRFQYFERFQRGAGGLAGAQGEPGFRVWLDDWRVEQTAERKYHLAAGEGDLRLELDLADVKGPVFQGDRGYSQKGDEPGNASYYVSLTRLVSQGTVEVGGVRYAVSGLSWMDHEFSTSALSQGQVGWDWFSIQLQDGSELMMYTIRREDGGVDPYSSGTVILPDGSTRRLGANDFTIRAEDSWESPHSGGVYPSAWVIEVPSEGLVLRVRPRLADQELNVSFIYWEGAVRVEGEKEGVRIEGSGYVELTGYAQSLENTF
uniref:Carotenoid 1,2-hydratase n=1 Tax=Anaerolinea thermolimosa TaxID=229919 RepID=A0A7C4PJ99_9CHLR